MGNVYTNLDDYVADDLRMSTGIGALWMSPVGPLAVSFAIPFNDQGDDDTQPFQFSLGAGF